MTIKDCPEGERPRERLLAHGARALSDAELLATSCAPAPLDEARWIAPGAR
jgi:hypothetical protein